MRALSLRRLGVALCLMALCVFFAGSARADDSERERKIKGLHEKIQELHQEAEELDELGKHDKAEKVEQYVQKLKKQLMSMLRNRTEAPDPRRINGILRDLLGGIEALQALGGHEEVVGHLKHLVADLKSEAGRGEKPHKARKESSKKRVDESRRLEHAMELMRMAVKVLSAAERREAAEIVEHALHVQAVIHRHPSRPSSIRPSSIRPSSIRPSSITPP
jgi:hypothetical protein